MTVRVTGPSGAADVALPAGRPVVELVADLVRALLPGAPLGSPGDIWHLHRLGGRALPPQHTLEQAGVHDGESLHLSPQSPPEPPRPVDDPLEALARGTALVRRWDERARLLALSAAVVLLGVAATGLALAVPLGGPALPLLVAGGLLATALALPSTERGRDVVAFAAALAALPALAAAGLATAVATDAAPPGLVAGTAAGLALGGAAASPVVPGRAAWWAGAMATGVSGALGGALVSAGWLTTLRTAAVLATVWVVALAALPWLVTRNRSWLEDDAPDGSGTALILRATATRRVVDGISAGGAAVVAVGGVLLALSDAGLPRGLAAALAVVLGLRARRSAFLVESGAAMLAASMVLLALAQSLARTGGMTTRLVLLAVAVAVVALVATFAVLSERATAGARPGALAWWGQPRTLRLLDVLEGLGALGVLPLLAGVLGLYGSAADAGARL